MFEAKLGVKLVPKGFAESIAGSVDQTHSVRAYSGESYSSGKAMTPLTTRSEVAGDSDGLPNSFAELVYKAQVLVEYTVESK